MSETLDVGGTPVGDLINDIQARSNFWGMGRHSKPRPQHPRSIVGADIPSARELPESG